MKTSIQILPGIKYIGWLDGQHLPKRVDLAAICRMPIAILTDIYTIDFFDEPQCECKTTKEGGSYTDTASLKFSCGEQLPHLSAIAFVVTDVNDKSYLIGSREAPHPIVEVTQLSGIPSNDAAGYHYEIKHVALKSLVPCII